MRRLVIGLAIAVGLCVAATVAVVLSLNRIIEANRARIVAGMSEGFGRPVHVERIAAAFHGGFALELDGLRIADDPAFSAEDFLTTERAYAVVKLWPLFNRRLEVRRIAVEAPHLTIIRTAKGLNVDSLGRRSGPPAAAPKPPPSTPAEPGAPAAVPAFAIALVNLEDGAVRWIDRTGPKPSETTVAPLDVRLTDLSLTTPMRIEIDAATTATPPATFRLRGTMGPVGDPPFAADVPIEHRIALEGDGFAIPELTVAGRVRRTPAGTPVASITVAAPSVRAGGVEVGALDVAMLEQDGVAILQRMAFRVFGGTVQGKGRVEHAGAAPRFSFETALRGVDVSQALATRAPDVAARFQGRLDGDVTLSGAGADDTAVRRSLAGAGKVVVRNGRLVGVNVAEGVLEGATGVAGLVSLVPPRVRERYPEIFATDDTRFDELASEIRIGGERIHVDAMNVAARDYAVRGKGVITFAQQADLTATLIASQALTADVAGAVKESRYLHDDAGRLAIPFRFAGVLPNVRPQPDTAFVARVLQKALVGEGLGRLLGGGKPSDPNKPGTKPTEDVIQRGLDKLFGR